MAMEDCNFCKIINDKYHHEHGNIIAETETLIVLPSLGGFVENYQLIIPKEHIFCFGELTKEELIVLNMIIIWQQEINKKYFNKGTLLFEHGALNPKNESGKSVVHAHLHIFPSEKSMLDEINKYDFGVEKINDISDLKEICQIYETYLYYHDLDGQDYIITHHGVPSQFLRKVMADSLDIKEWNWREFPHQDAMEKCVKFYKDNELSFNPDGYEF